MTGISTIPAGAPFAAVLARELLREAGGDPAALARMRVLLPTRRACRTVREAFLRESGGRPVLLPRLQPIGDVEDEELALYLAATPAAEAILSLPPALPPLRRRMLLARALLKVDAYARAPDQALALADDLALLMDQIHVEGLDLSVLPDLVEGEYARHWEITVSFLGVLTESWPAILAGEGAIDAADRRNRLLRILAQHWREAPPPGPIVAAGMTGSIPAVAELLSVIAGLGNGRIVLPGLDMEMDEECWAALDDGHPQAAMKQLLTRAKVSRADVTAWSALPISPACAGRAFLAREMMRPSGAEAGWRGLAENAGALAEGVRDLTRLDCETPEEEAQAIALMFRHALETPGKTAALVTPDRRLARRVAMACRRWGLEIDDSAGLQLDETETGIFLRLAVQAAAENFAPGALLSLLRHRLCGLGRPRAARDGETGRLERLLLRGPKPPPGLEGLRARSASLRARHAALGPALDALDALLDDIGEAFAPLLPLCDGGMHPAGEWLRRHIETAERLTADGFEPGAAILWRGQPGEEAARFLSMLREDAALLPPLDARGYPAVLTRLMKGVPVRPRYGTHPRLAILGRLEARLAGADVMILGGLNERSWPPDTGHDPWMSRPMRARFGLPSPETAIGQAAHDFIQGFCAGEAVLTRAMRQEGAPTVPSRWLQRLEAVLQAAGIAAADSDIPWLPLSRALDRSPVVRPCARPAPRPPLEARPRILPVTAIETWIADPYSVYARHILGLRKLDPLEKPADPSARGVFVHDVLRDFVDRHKAALPENAERILVDLGYARHAALADDSGFWLYWLPRFERIARWVAGRERDWRARALPFLVEADGRVSLGAKGGAFTLTARADRIDRLAGGGMAIIDYKTGGAWSAGSMRDGKSPQLPLEGLILDRGGFPGLEGEKTACLEIWKLTGGIEEGEIAALEGADAEAAILKCEGDLMALIDAYDDPSMPYNVLPDPARTLRFNDYGHLSRIQEWGVSGEEEGAA